MKRYYKNIIILLALLLSASILPASILDRLNEIVRTTAMKIRGWDLSMKEAMFYEKLDGDNVRCNLCPWNCVLENGQRGVCGVRVNIDGIMRSMVYGKSAALNIDPVEKKPMYHFMPGTYTYSMATVGCNLSCNFCQNWTLSQNLPEKSKHIDMSPEEIVKQALESGSQSIAYTYSEPTIFYEYMYETAQLANKNGLKNIMVTCGYINEKPLRELCKYIDGANVDLKGFTEEFYREYTKSDIRHVKNALKVMKDEGIFIEITNLIIPGANDNLDDIRRLCVFVRDSLGADTPIHFSRFHPNYKLKDRPPTPAKTLKDAYNIAKEEGLLFVYIGNMQGMEGENTVCPNCGKTVVRRSGYHVDENNIVDGRCSFCDTHINGIW